MIVCVCHRVSDKTIARLASGGASFNDIQMELGVATQCGKCETCARSLVQQCHADQPVAFIRDAGQSCQSAAFAV